MIKYFSDSMILAYVDLKKDILHKIASSPDLEKIAEESLRKKPLEPGYRRILINALGAGEYWGFNKRGDYFPENELNPSEYRFGIPYGYQTYETHGKVYLHHKKDNPEFCIGKVAMAYWHDGLKRVFVLGDVLEKKAANYLEHLRSGNPVPTSMGAAVLFDACSICAPDYEYLTQFHPDEVKLLIKQGQLPGVRTKPSESPCIHVPHRVSTYYPELDKYAYMVNYYPVFIDISIVDRPADSISAALKKIASIDESLIFNTSNLARTKTFIHEQLLPQSVDSKDILLLVKLANFLGPKNTLNYLSKLRIPLTKAEFEAIKQTKIVKTANLDQDTLIHLATFFVKRSAAPHVLHTRVQNAKPDSALYLEAAGDDHVNYIMDIINDPELKFDDNHPITKLAKYTAYYGPHGDKKVSNTLSRLYAASFIGLI